MLTRPSLLTQLLVEFRGGFLWSFVGPVTFIVLVTVSPRPTHPENLKHSTPLSPCTSFLPASSKDTNLNSLLPAQGNAIIFVITVWKLTQKFSEINPDIKKLKKVR